MTVTARPLLLAAAAASLIVLAPHAPSAVAAKLPAEVAGTPMPSLAPMVKRVSPSVVSIQTRGKVREQRNPLMDDPFFRRFFNMPDSPAEREFQAAGSGVVVDAKQGYIITNAHVVDKASEITVFTQDDRQFKATVVGKDTATDVAVLQVKDAKLQEIALADSDTAAVGDFVVAIGNPFGLQHTVTSGI
ncbi:MAG: trypsin-like peptidase domain-containing protein, partial [Gammaproteobacteria bacterium]